MIHCFYHDDLGGHCSGAIVKYRFPEAVMHPINYGDEFPWSEVKPEDEVYMVDFALQPFSLMWELNDTCNLVWIDHHNSAIVEWQKEPSSVHACVLDTTKAACELTWEYLFPDRPIPLAVKLLSLYDSWTYHGHELGDMVLPFQMRMRMESLDPKDWENVVFPWHSLFERDTLNIRHPDKVDRYVKEGRLLLRFDTENKKRYAATYAFETELRYLGDEIEETQLEHGFKAKLQKCKTLKAIAINLGHTNSKVFDSVWRKSCPNCPSPNHPDKFVGCQQCKGTGYIEPYDLMITFVRRKDRLWNVSLYSTNEYVDCEKIAASFGGHGDKHEAEFTCGELPFEY